MRVEKVLVIGLGEIGAPLLEIVKGVYSAEGLDIEPKEIHGPVDVLHICFPYSVDFVETATNYVNKFNPKLTIIESTVLPFTTSKILKAQADRNRKKTGISATRQRPNSSH